MSLVLPVLYHWAPETCRRSIVRHGLRPTTPTESRFEESFLAVCLGTSPSHAWSLSGSVFRDRCPTWDLWQVTLDEDDDVHPRPFTGYRLQEIRVANRIPKRRIWHVGSRDT